MKTALKLIMGVGCLAALSFASTVSSFSSNNSTSTHVTLSTFDAFGNNMGPMVITATFSSGPGSTCTWVTAAGGCTSADGFLSISYSPLTDQTYPLVGSDGVWTLHDGSSIRNITSVTINTFAGNVALDRCMSGPGTFNNNNNTLNSDCDAEGTLGSNDGWTANDAPGGSNVTASVLYSNLLYTGATPASAIHDLYGALTFSFGSTFNPRENFTWRMDTDLLDPPAGVPEPATLALVGGALVMLGALRHRKAR